MKQKILKVKIGDVYVGGKSIPVFNTAWKRQSKDGKTTYYEMSTPMFPNEVDIPDKKQESSSQDL